MLRERLRARELVVAFGVADPGGLDRIRARERGLGADPHLDAAASEQLVVHREDGVELVGHDSSSQSSARGIGVPGSTRRRSSVYG